MRFTIQITTATSVQHASCTAATLFDAQCVGLALLGDGNLGRVIARRA